MPERTFGQPGDLAMDLPEADGKPQALVLPAPAADRLDAYLVTREDIAGVPVLRGRPGAGRPRRVLFATDSGGRLFPLRRLGTGQAARQGRRAA